MCFLQGFCHKAYKSLQAEAASWPITVREFTVDNVDRLFSLSDSNLRECTATFLDLYVF